MKKELLISVEVPTSIDEYGVSHVIIKLDDDDYLIMPEEYDMFRIEGPLEFFQLVDEIEDYFKSLPE